MSVCYPTSPRAEARLHPLVWRTPTAHHTLNPRWQCWRDIQYGWFVPIETAECRARACRQVLGDGRALTSGTKVKRFCEGSPAASAKLRPYVPAKDGPGEEDEVM